MPNESTEIDWAIYFPRIKKGVDDGKFKVLRQPAPLTQDYLTNVARVMEFMWRCGRNADVTVTPSSLFVPVRDMWFIVDHEHYEGIYFHCCESRQMLMFYTRYQHYYEQYMAARKTPEMFHNVQDVAKMCRETLWGVYNSTGCNTHFHDRDHNDWFNDDWRDTPRIRANDTLEFYSCSRCIKPMPKQIVLVNKLQRSKLQDVL